MKFKSVFGIFVGLWLLWFSFIVAIICGIIYVAWHFISKVW
jgi:hypothetical protein